MPKGQSLVGSYSRIKFIILTPDLVLTYILHLQTYLIIKCVSERRCAYGGRMFGTVTPSSADCEIGFFDYGILLGLEREKANIYLSTPRVAWLGSWIAWLGLVWYGIQQHDGQRAVSRVVTCTLCRLLNQTKIWIRRIRRDQRSDTDHTQPRSNAAERVTFLLMGKCLTEELLRSFRK
jgi:hypothetical protein